jgi:MFS family permease
MIETKKQSDHYAWVIVAACAVIMFATFGIYYSFGVFFNSLQAEFNWSRAQTSSLFSLYLVFSGFFSILCGRALDRFGPKRVVIVMGMATGLSLLMISNIKDAWQLYLYYSIILSLGTGPMYIVAMGTASRWVVKKRGTAVGIVGAGAGLGTVVLAPVAAWMIAAYNWRQAYLILGAIAMATIIPAALLLKKGPRTSGGASLTGRPSKLKTPSAPDLSLKATVKTANFRLFFIIWFCYSFCLHLVMGHVVPRATDTGMPPLKAAALLSVLTACVVPCRLISGVVSDRVNKKSIFIGLALFHLFVMGWLAAADQPWMFFVFAVLFGIAYGSIDPPVIAMVGDAFETANLGSIMGLLMVAWGLGSAAGPYFGGLVYDYTGAYTLAFITAGSVMGVSAVCGTRLKI